MDKFGREAIEAVVQRKREPYAEINVLPLSPSLGAEIGGVDLSGALTNRQFDELNRAFLEHKVLVFRDQQLSSDDHKRFGRRFGQLHVHALQAMRGGDHERLEVAASGKSKYVAGEDWHADVTCDERPPMGSMLYITQTPESGGGDTCFASTIRAFEALSPAMQAFLETLTATHDGAKPYTGGYGQAAPEGGWPKNVHPVVIRHPGSGKQSLYVNRGFTTRINELGRRESDALLEFLWNHTDQQLEFQCRVRWTPNTLVFWDNLATHHHAVWDYFPFSRFGQRVSIVGERPAA
jgi:taurine dioxygenase